MTPVHFTNGAVGKTAAVVDCLHPEAKKTFNVIFATDRSVAQGGFPVSIP